MIIDEYWVLMLYTKQSNMLLAICINTSCFLLTRSPFHVAHDTLLIRKMFLTNDCCFNLEKIIQYIHVTSGFSVERKGNIQRSSRYIAYFHFCPSFFSQVRMDAKGMTGKHRNIQNLRRKRKEEKNRMFLWHIYEYIYIYIYIISLYLFAFVIWAVLFWPCNLCFELLIKWFSSFQVCVISLESRRES